MKKIQTLAIAFILTLAMLCTAALALEPADILGTWYLNAMEVDGMSMNPAMFGMELAMTLEEGGTARMQMSGEDDTMGTWVIDGDEVTIEMDGEGLVFTIEDGNLVASEDEMKMVFGKEQAEDTSAEIAPARTDAVLADFNGTWNAYLADFEDMKLPIELLGIEVTLVIEDGNVVMTVSEDTLELAGDVSEGILMATGEDAGEAVTMAFSLHEDGVLSCIFEDAFLLYFQKAA